MILFLDIACNNRRYSKSSVNLSWNRDTIVCRGTAIQLSAVEPQYNCLPWNRDTIVCREPLKRNSIYFKYHDNCTNDVTELF